jgi:hypothetical protein
MTTSTLKRNSDATVKWFSGGKAVPGSMSLVSLCASVQKLNPKTGGPGADRNPIPGHLVKAGDFGQLGDDGMAYKAVPNGETCDLTLRVSGNEFTAGTERYTRGLNPPTKHVPTIMANLITLSPDHVVDGAEFCVGQYVSFFLEFNPELNYVNLVGSWRLPDKFVNERWQHFTVGPVTGDMSYYGSVNYRINNNLLNNTNHTVCWFVNGQGGKASIGANLRFPNGHYASVAAIGKFAVVKPHEVDFDWDPITVQFHVMDDGTSDQVDAAVNWLTYIERPDHFTGTATYAQLIARDYNYNYICVGILTWTHSFTTSGEYWLDKDYPYGVDTPVHFDLSENPVKHVDHGDSPGLDARCYFNTSVVITDHFKTYLQFQPDSAGSIPVTIGRIDWGWSCSALKTNGVWSWTPHKDNPTPHWEDDSFPQWTNVYNGQ